MSGNPRLHFPMTDWYQPEWPFPISPTSFVNTYQPRPILTTHLIAALSWSTGCSKNEAKVMLQGLIESGSVMRMPLGHWVYPRDWHVMVKLSRWEGMISGIKDEEEYLKLMGGRQEVETEDLARGEAAEEGAAIEEVDKEEDTKDEEKSVDDSRVGLA